MSEPLSLERLLAAIDAQDAKAFCAFLTQDACFRFGNAPPVVGRPAIESTVAVFFKAIQAVCHRLENQWLLPDAAICTGTVTYTRHGGSTLQVPFANVMKLRADGICDYLIFTDNSLLFAA